MEIEEFKSKLPTYAPAPMNDIQIDNIIKKSIDASRKHKTQPIGDSYNLLIVMEELSELIQAISKFQRNGEPNVKNDSYYKVLEEYADVVLVLHYVQQIIGLDQADIERAIRVKVDRLDNKLYESGMYE